MCHLWLSWVVVAWAGAGGAWPCGRSQGNSGLRSEAVTPGPACCVNLNQLKLTVGIDSAPSQGLRTISPDSTERQYPHRHMKLGWCVVHVGMLGLARDPFFCGQVLGLSWDRHPMLRSPRGLRGPVGPEWLLPSVLQLVNQLGSTRGGVDLFMPSPALRAQEQLAAVEGKHQPGPDPPRAWVGRDWVKPLALLTGVHPLEGQQCLPAPVQHHRVGR